MSRSVFVSHVYEDSHYKGRLAQWAREGRLGSVVITGECDDVRPGGPSAIKAHLGPRMRGAAVLLVLVGDNSHDRRWLDYEVQYAQSHHLRVVVVRIPGTRGAAPRAVRHLPIETFEPTALSFALN